MTRVLILSSVFYQDIADISLEMAKKILSTQNIDFNVIFVPGAFEIPNAANLILENEDYDGLIALGCIIKGETSHYDIVCKECASGLNDIAIHYSTPMGFGIITANNKSQADCRAKEYAKRATTACIELIKIKEQLTSFDNEHYTKYNN